MKNKKISKTNIEWAEYVWNPVWGCLNKCEYCYARKIAKRFAGEKAEKELSIYNNFYEWPMPFYKLKDNLYRFNPTWLESNFQKKFPKKPSRIFVNSMSDIKYWKEEWMDRALKKIKEYPQHIFMFLTKNLELYKQYNFPKNCWLGLTINKTEQYHTWSLSFKNIRFVSIEPIMEFIPAPLFKKKYIDWIIIGAETGNRKNKVIPKSNWIVELLKLRKEEIQIFMKNNLQSIWDNDLIQEFPN